MEFYCLLRLSSESIFSISDIFFLTKIVKNYKIHQNIYLKNNYQERIQDDIYKNYKNMVIWNFLGKKLENKSIH